MSDEHNTKLDPAIVATLYAEHAEELRRFVFGLLRDAQLTQDVLQTTFTRLVEQGHATREESRKGWLFRVAYNEAMLCRRLAGVHDRAVRRIGEEAVSLNPAEALVQQETVERIRDELERLTPAQREVVLKRIYEGKTFAEIAQELDAPLGTVLGRMHNAIQKIRQRLTRRTQDDD